MFKLASAGGDSLRMISIPSGITTALPATGFVAPNDVHVLLLDQYSWAVA